MRKIRIKNNTQFITCYMTDYHQGRDDLATFHVLEEVWLTEGNHHILTLKVGFSQGLTFFRDNGEMEWPVITIQVIAADIRDWAIGDRRFTTEVLTSDGKWIMDDCRIVHAPYGPTCDWQREGLREMAIGIAFTHAWKDEG